MLDNSKLLVIEILAHPGHHELRSPEELVFQFHFVIPGPPHLVPKHYQECHVVNGKVLSPNEELRRSVVVAIGLSKTKCIPERA